MTEQTQPTDAELLPCPFCGTQPDECDIGQFVVECPSCAIVGPASDNSNAARRAWNTRWGTPAGAGEVVAWPATCDGKEQEAWETWAQTERYDMTQHPLHYLFLNERTYAARQGWKAGLLYAVEQMKATTTQQPTQAQAGAPRVSPEQWQTLFDDQKRLVELANSRADIAESMLKAFQAQAGAVPLTDEWIRSKCKEPWIFETAKQWVRIAESAHGIKGADHG